MKKLLKVYILISVVFLLTGCDIFNEDDSWIKLPDGVVFVELGTTSFDYSDKITCYDENESIVTENIVFDDSQINYDVLSGGNVTVTCTLESGTILTGTFQVGVTDSVPPIIIDLIETEFTVEINTPFSFNSYTCQDNSNTACYITYPVFTTAVLGDHELVIDVHDMAGNVGHFPITLTVVDTISPTFDILNQTIEAGEMLTLEEYLISPSDNSNEQLIYSEPNTVVDYNTAGVYDVTVRLSDSSGNYFDKDIVVTVVDTIAPTFDVIGIQVIEICISDIDWSTYILNATDNSDDDLIFIEEIDLISYDDFGTYSVTVTAKDLSNNSTSETFEVTVVDTIAPTFEMIENFTIEAGTSDIDWVSQIIMVVENSNGDVIFNEVSDLIDYMTPGEYDVTVSVTDETGNVGSKTFTVTVVDTTAPIIAGAFNITYVIGSGDIDYLSNVSANDLVDGDLTSSIIVDSSLVDMAVIGHYQVTYTVVDSSGNEESTMIYVEVVE